MYKSEVKYYPTRLHDQDIVGEYIVYPYTEFLTIPYSTPSEEYIHTIKFMEQVKKDLESMCYYTFYNGDSGDESTKPVAAMGAGSGGWPTNSNDWAKVYQKAFPEAPTGQQEPVQQDPKDMAVKAETEEDRERLWQAVMDYGKGG